MVGKVKTVKSKVVGSIGPRKTSEVMETLIADAVKAEFEKREMTLVDSVSLDLRDAILENTRLRESRRDRLAAAALTGMLMHGVHHTEPQVCRQAYKWADQMVEASEVK